MFPVKITHVNEVKKEPEETTLIHASTVAIPIHPGKRLKISLSNQKSREAREISLETWGLGFSASFEFVVILQARLGRDIG